TRSSETLTRSDPTLDPGRPNGSAVLRSLAASQTPSHHGTSLLDGGQTNKAQASCRRREVAASLALGDIWAASSSTTTVGCSERILSRCQLLRERLNAIVDRVQHGARALPDHVADGRRRRAALFGQARNPLGQLAAGPGAIFFVPFPHCCV